MGFPYSENAGRTQSLVYYYSVDLLLFANEFNLLGGLIFNGKLEEKVGHFPRIGSLQ